jgi:hypothetical protein
MSSTELILSIDVRSSSGKILLCIIEGCKSGDYIDRNSTFTWGNLKKKFGPVLAPSLVNTEELLGKAS